MSTTTFWISTCALQVRTQSANIPLLVVTGPSFLLCHSNPQWLSLANYPAIPLGQDQSTGSHKATHNVGGKLVIPCVFSFPTGRTGGSKRRFHFLVVLHWPSVGAVWSTCNCFPYPCKVVCLGLCGARGAWVSLPVLGLSHRYLVFE